MDQKRIGGGLLATVGVFAPWIADMLGITLPPIIGYPLLTLCGVAALFGLWLLFRSAPAATNEGPLPQQSTFIDADDVGSIVSLGDKSSAGQFIKARKTGSIWTVGSRHRPKR